MRKIRAVVVMPLLIAALALASCGHASVAGNSCPLLCQAPPQPSASTAPSVAGYWQQQFRDFKTGITGAVGAPAPASFGGSPVPAQIAASDHPEFETDAINGAFPALASSLQATSSGLSAASSIQSATATLTSTMPTRGNIPDTVIQLSVPSIGLNAQWDVSVAASIAAGTNKFNGSTAVTSAPPGPFSLNASASGSINGAFYGPAAQNLGAIWTLSDGTTSAIGGVVARH